MIKFLLKWAWSTLAVGLLFDACSTQLFYNVSRLEGADLKLRIGFALGGLVGDIPAIAIAAILISAIVFALTRKISPRIFVLSLGFGCFLNALIIHPIMVQIYKPHF